MQQFYMPDVSQHVLQWHFRTFCICSFRIVLITCTGNWEKCGGCGQRQVAIFVHSQMRAFSSLLHSKCSETAETVESPANNGEDITDSADVVNMEHFDTEQNLAVLLLYISLPKHFHFCFEASFFIFVCGILNCTSQFPYFIT